MPTIRSPFIRIAIVWLAFLAIWLLLGSLREFFWGVERTGYLFEAHVASAVLATVLAVPVVVAARRLLDRETVASLGLPLSSAALKPFLVGALAFLAPFTLGMAIVLALGWTRVTPLVSWGEIVLFVPVLVGLVFLFEALPEELAFRGYIQANLVKRMSRLWAVVGQAALFSLWGAALWGIGAGTVPVDRLAMFFFVGLVLGLVRGVTGSVWAAIGLHLAFQTCAQLLLNAERGHFAVEGADMLQLVALGVVPFSLAVPLVERLSGKA